MKTEFIKEVAKNNMLNKLTTALPILRKTHLKPEDVKEIINLLKRNGLLEAIKGNGQDVAELKGIAIDAFDDAVKIMRERLVNHLTVMECEIK